MLSPDMSAPSMMDWRSDKEIIMFEQLPDKKQGSVLKWLLGISIVVILLLAWCGTARGQDLGEAAMPSPVLFDTAPDCLSAAAKVLEPKNAAKFCLEARKLEAERAKVAAKAAQPPRDPCSSWFLAPSYCYGGGRYYSSTGYYSGGYYSSGGAYGTTQRYSTGHGSFQRRRGSR